MTTVGTLNVKVSADTSGLKRAIESEAEKSGRGFGSKFGKGLAGMGGLLAGVGVAGVAAGGAIAAFGVKAAAANETAAVSFNVLLGNAEKAKTFLSDLNDFAAKTPFDLPGIKSAASKLLSVGVASERVIPLMGAIGDATAAMGTGADGVNRATAAVQKMGVTGKVTMESINMLSEAGVPIIDALAAKMGKTPAEIQKMVSKGAVKVDDVLSAIETRSGEGFKRVSGMMDEQSKTFAGQLSTLKDEMEQTLAGAAQPLLDALKGALPEITDALKGIIEGFKPVIEQIGPLVEKLVPVLAPVAEVLGSLGATVGKVLVDAFTTLLPSVMPVLDVLKDLATRIGPVLAPIIGRIAEVLARVLDAVTPLLQPLIDLVFTILDAAGPIFDVVVDVVLSLVDALAPLLGIVGTLLKPLGELVGMLAEALMPILKPLLPLIEAIATVLADVLGRAIGLIITGLGYFIQAAAKVAPFILRNLTEPIVRGFLSMAENVVSTAAEAFSWVPGLGDKLGEAKKAIGDFKKNAESGIKSAADTIEKEGSRIGKGLVDQGVATMTDPSSAARITGAAKGLGVNAADALASGIRSGQIPVQAAGAALGNAATKGAKGALDINSPSKVFMKLGGNVVEGFTLGVGELGKVSDKVRQQIETAVSKAEARINKWLTKQREVLDKAIDAWKDYRQQAMAAMAGPQVADAWRQSTDSQDAAQQAYDDLTAAQKAYNDAKAKSKDGTDLSSEADAVAQAQAAYDAAKASIVSFEDAWKQQVKQSDLHRETLTAIGNNLALDPQGRNLLMGQLFQMDPAQAIAIGQHLLGTQDDPNSLLGSMVADLKAQNVWNSSAADSMANTAKGAGIEQAKAAIKGIDEKIKAEEKRIQKLGADIGDGMVIGFRSKKSAFKAEVDAYIAAAKSALDSNSPSKVFIGIGEDVGDGFSIGVNRSMPDLNSLVPSGLNRMFGPSLTMETAAPSVQVFIGDRELTDIVRTEVGANNDGLARALTLGRR